MPEVWVCETGDYEQRGVWSVAVSVAAGVADIKATHCDPYIVRWEEPTEDHGGDWTLTGHFEAVPGKSTKHTAHYEFTRYEVIGTDPKADAYPTEVTPVFRD
jgi:hypothetical protein